MKQILLLIGVTVLTLMMVGLCPFGPPPAFLFVGLLASVWMLAASAFFWMIDRVWDR